MSTLEVVQQMMMSEFDLKGEQLGASARLAELGIDSLATIEFLFLLEERFKLDLNSEPVPIATVGDIAIEIDRLLAHKLADAPA